MQVHQILDSLRRDVKYAQRGLQRSPGFTFTVVVMLALGIGANTAIFSLVDRLLIRPLPYPESRQLVMLYESFRSTRNNVSMSNWLDWQRMNKSFDTLAAWNTVSETFTGGGEPELVAGQTVSFEFFPALKIAPSLGRAFTAEEDQPGAAPVVILSDRFWKRRFDGDPSIIGKKIELDSIPREVVGVMPPGFYFGNPTTEYWTPYRMD